jgi:hypothetical protein
LVTGGFSVAAAVVYPKLSWADGQLPYDLQAELLSKVAGYDRNLKERAGAKVRVVVSYKQGDAESEASNARMKHALGQLPQIAGLPHTVVGVPYQGADSLRKEVQDNGAAIIYLTAGLEPQVKEIAARLSGTSVLTACGVMSYVWKGAVLGLGMQSGKPKLYINLPQAKRQEVSFETRVLSLAEIVR